MTDFFKNIPLIKYEGRSSTNDFAFHYYNPDEVIGDQTMKDHLRFAASYWHTFQGDGSDPFGAGTMRRPWDGVSDPMSLAQIKVEAALEFMEKLGLEYFCFHDLDLAPEGTSFQERNHNLDVIVAHLKAQLKNTSIKVLWGTSNTFTHPRFVHGAATSCDAKVFACTAAQIKKALEITKELGGENYVFWGGREGYETLLNTDTALELDNYARLLRMAVDYAAEIEFRGPLLIEPKPKEPTKHQYDFDVMTVLAFLRKYHLDKHFKLNIEANHATLAGHTFQHELNLARINNVLGSVDVNQGDLLLGWDTDQFPTNLYDAVLAMSEILQNGGIAPGGLNFDAKVRRGSFSPEALVKAYLAGMDTLAQGLRIAYKINQDGVFEEVIRNRYHSYREGLGKDIIEGRVGFVELEKYVLAQGHIEPDSSSQEHLERMLNHYLLES